MTVRRAEVFACGAMATLFAVILAASAGAEPSRQVPRGAVESCATQSGATLTGAFTSSRNLVVGPLALIGAGGTPTVVSTSTGEVWQKFPLLVRNGHRVTMELSRTTGRGAGLAYGLLPQGETHLRNTHRVVTFIACRRGHGSWSSADGEPVTFWSGGVVARSPRCVPLLVWVDNERSPRHAVIRLGVSKCS